MTVTAETRLPPSGPLLNGSWDDLPPAVELPEPLAEQPDLTGKGVAGNCLGCGQPIIREPGSRGRLPKYHPDCRPLKSSTAVSGTGVRRSSTTAKAEAEADRCIASFQSLVTKSAVMLSVVDKFDAFALMVALPNICENLRGVLIRYDGLRKEMLVMETGGSIIGLAISVGMLMLPIAAHHGLLGKGNAAKMLVNLPFTMMKIAQQLKEGSAALTEMMREQLENAAKEAKARAAATAQPPTNAPA